MSPARCSALAPGGGVTAFTSPPTKKLPWLPITSGRSAAPAAEQTPRDATTAHTDASLRKPMKAPLFLSTREYARGPAPCHLRRGGAARLLLGCCETEWVWSDGSFRCRDDDSC